MGSETEKKVYFALINENPVAVGLRQWGTDLPLANISLVAIEFGNLSSVFSKLDWQNTMTQVIDYSNLLITFKMMTVKNIRFVV